MVRMTDAMFDFLYLQIPKSYISVINNVMGTVYSFDYIDPNGELVHFDLTCAYSHAGTKNVYAMYELTADSELIASAIKPVFDRGTKPKTMPRHLTLADKLESLLLLCSMKIIEQEYTCHSRHMLKTFINDFNQKSS